MTTDIRSLRPGSRIRYSDSTRGRELMGLSARVAGTITRVHYSRGLVDIIDDDGCFREYVSVNNIQDEEPVEVRSSSGGTVSRRYGRDAAASPPNAVDHDQLRAADRPGQGLGPEERREFVRYCRELNINDSIGAANAMAAWRQRARG